MSKARAFGIIARGVLRFANEHPSLVVPVVQHVAMTFAEVVEMRAAEELADQQRSDQTLNRVLDRFEQRIERLEKGRAS